MAPELRGEYSEVEKLVRLLLVSSASSAEVERSFSALHRLKTWLRSTMTQLRLNSLAVWHVRQELLDLADVNALIEQFVSKNDRRVSMFGNWLFNICAVIKWFNFFPPQKNIMSPSIKFEILGHSIFSAPTCPPNLRTKSPPLTAAILQMVLSLFQLLESTIWA